MAVLIRLLRINAALWGYFAWWVLVKAGWRRPKQTPGQRLAQTFERLGTTFIKFGQVLSVRADLLPDDYLVALRGLQDRIPAFSSATAIAEIETAFGRSVDELFAEFDPAPLAAASIAQVHRGRLRDGRDVVVKVRRPGIKEQVSLDMRMLRRAVRTLLWFAPAMHRYQPLAVIQEINVHLQKELDFRQEARNIARFARALEKFEYLYIPRAVEGLCTPAVMVQERSRGVRIDDASLKEQGPALARQLTGIYLYQLLVLGAFHGDPHPGNLFVMPDRRICLHDFGLVGALDAATRRNLAAFMQALACRNGEWLLDVYLELGVLSGRVDRRVLLGNIEELLQEYAGLPLNEWSVPEIFMRIARMGMAQNVRLPHNLLVLARAMYLLESTTRGLDPAFNPFEYIEEQSGELLREAAEAQAAGAETARLKYEAATAVQGFPATLAGWLYQLRANGIEMKIRHHGLDDFERHVDRSSNRVALALVILGLFIAASILMTGHVGPSWAGMPLLALLGYALALWFTWRLVTGITRSGRL